MQNVHISSLINTARSTPFFLISTASLFKMCASAALSSLSTLSVKTLLHQLSQKITYCWHCTRTTFSMHLLTLFSRAHTQFSVTPACRALTLWSNHKPVQTSQQLCHPCHHCKFRPRSSTNPHRKLCHTSADLTFVKYGSPLLGSEGLGPKC